MKSIPFLAGVVSTLAAGAAWSQSPGPLTITAARTAARTASAEVAAARATLAAAVGRATQARAYANPTLSVSREATSVGAQDNAQLIAAIDQAIEMPGARSARRTAAAVRRDAAAARLADAERALDYLVARAFADVVAADRRRALSDSAVAVFDAAVAISERRLREGDIAGHAVRRIRLEAARIAASRAEVVLAQDAARIRLAALISPSPDGRPFAGSLVAPSLPRAIASLDSLQAWAGQHRADVRAAALEADAATADAELAAAERVPSPTIQLGRKTETALGGQSLAGYVAGISLPLPLWDRRGGTVEAAEADLHRRRAEASGAARRARSEVAVASSALRAVEAQLAALSAERMADAAAARSAADAAFAEGEISLLEWLDTMRAYHDMQSSITELQAIHLARVAELERAVGISLIEAPR